MLIVAGTVPIKELPLVASSPNFRIPCTMGTAAMVSTAVVTCEYLGIDRPFWITAGDIGEGNGSRVIYRYLIERVPEISPTVLSMHYLLPIMTAMRKVIESVEKCDKKPALIADAGSMYAAKAAGLAQKFDIFTPDAGELAFLADPDATHPAYIRQYLFGIDDKEAKKLIEQAYESGNAARVLLVKNPIDYIAEDGRVITTISEPNIPELEAIGGTGDTITGLISALVSAGYTPREAAIVAAKANRMVGKFSDINTATKIAQLIPRFPDVFRRYLREWSKARHSK